MYAVTRSILRALVDPELSTRELTALNTDKADVTLNQLAMAAGLPRRATRACSATASSGPFTRRSGQGADCRRADRQPMRKASPKGFKGMSYAGVAPLRFLTGRVPLRLPRRRRSRQAAVILPDTRGRPPTLPNWVPVAAQGQAAEEKLGARLRGEGGDRPVPQRPGRHRPRRRDGEEQPEPARGRARAPIGIVAERLGDAAGCHLSAGRQAQLGGALGGDVV